MADVPRQEEIKQFYLINSKQRRVDTDLALALLQTMASSHRAGASQPRGARQALANTCHENHLSDRCRTSGTVGRTDKAASRRGPTLSGAVAQSFRRFSCAG